MTNLLLTKRLLLLLEDTSVVYLLETSVIALMVGIACVGTIMIYFPRHVTSLSLSLTHRSNKKACGLTQSKQKKKEEKFL